MSFNTAAHALARLSGLLLFATWVPATAVAQAASTTALASARPWGRISFFTNAAQSTADEGESQGFAEFVTTATIRSADASASSLEFGLDARASGYSVEGRDPRVSLYDAWAGVKLMDGALRVRGGHMWINDLGGLGAVAGGLVEYRRAVSRGTLRVGAFGGAEPLTYDTGYAADVRRIGGYAVFEASTLRRHVLGYVLIRDASLTERSVISSTNFVPIGKTVFIYQALEYDLVGPAGQGDGGLTYFFTNARVAATSRVDLQGTFHRGRSIDTRSITLDQINGRPVPVKALEGMLFESLGGRVTVEAVRGVRAYAGYGRDKNNRDSDPTGRFNVGGSASNVLRSGVDTTVSFTRIDRGAPGSYDSWWVSVGRSIGPRTYLSGDYSSSLSVLRFTRSDGFVVESRPESRRYGATAIVNLGRTWSILATLERTDDDTSSEHRLLAGLTYRLP